MSDTLERNTLLDEIDIRQDELLDELDELNRRIEAVLRDQLAALGRGSSVEVQAKGGEPVVETGQVSEVVQQEAGGHAADDAGVSVATVQMPRFVDGPEQSQPQQKADEAA